MHQLVISYEPPHHYAFRKALPSLRYRALKEAAVQRGRTIGQLIDESLEFYGIKSREEAMDISAPCQSTCGTEGG